MCAAAAWAEAAGPASAAAAIAPAPEDGFAPDAVYTGNLSNGGEEVTLVDAALAVCVNLVVDWLLGRTSRASSKSGAAI